MDSVQAPVLAGAALLCAAVVGSVWLLSPPTLATVHGRAAWVRLFQPYFLPATAREGAWMAVAWGSVVAHRYTVSRAPIELGDLAEQLAAGPSSAPATGGNSVPRRIAFIACLYLGHVLFKELRWVVRPLLPLLLYTLVLQLLLLLLVLLLWPRLTPTAPQVLRVHHREDGCHA